MLTLYIVAWMKLWQELADMLIRNLHPQRSAERAVSGTRGPALLSAKNTKVF